MPPPPVPRAAWRVLGRVMTVVVPLVLALPVVVVTGNLRKIPVVGGWFGPPRLVASAPIDVGLDVTQVVAGDGAVWLLRASDHRLLRVSGGGGEIPVPDATRDLAVGGGRLWLLVGGGVVPADPSTGRIGEPLALAAPDGDFGSFSPDTMAWGAGGLWVMDDTRLLRVGPEGTVTQRVALPLDQTSPQSRLLVGKDSVWVVADRRYDVVVIRVDGASGEAKQTAQLPGMSLQPFDTGAFARDSIWFAARDKKTNDGYLVEVGARDAKVDKRRGTYAVLCPWAVRAGGGQLWQHCARALEHFSASLRVDGKANAYDEGLALVDWSVDADGDAWFVMQDGANRSVLRHASPPR